MAQSNFQVGDVVTLKSGSPEMTIKEIITKKNTLQGQQELPVNKIIAQWFVNNDAKSEEFTEPQLEKVQ